MAKVERICGITDSRSGKNVFEIQESSPLANPFVTEKKKGIAKKRVAPDKKTAVAMYAKYFDKMTARDALFKKAFDNLYDAFLSYDIILLKTSEPLDEPSFVDVIAKRLRSRFIKDKLAEMMEMRESELANEEEIY